MLEAAAGSECCGRAGGRRPRARHAAAAGGAARSPTTATFTTVQRYDQPVPPSLTAQDEFFEFLFSGSDMKYADAEGAGGQTQEPLPPFALKDVKMTINVDADYAVVQHPAHAQRRRDRSWNRPEAEGHLRAVRRALRSRRLPQTPPGAGRGGSAAAAGGAGGCTGQTRDTPRPGDVINNGADDDGSGTVALMALAKAFALGPKPKRSLLFVWHSGEEAGLYGSRYMADYPVVPIDKIAAQLNIDMIGRNRCDDPKEANTVYLVGSDRISTELHNLNEDANAALREADEAGLRDERSGGPGVDLHAQRSLQLRVEGHPDHLLHDRAAPATTTT